jgi:hypothetical protein
MSVLASLAAFSLRQVLGDGIDNATTAVQKSFHDHPETLPKAIQRAQVRAWQSLGIALAGDRLLDRVKLFRLFCSGPEEKEVREQIRAFLEYNAVAFAGMPGEVNAKCLAEMLGLLRSGLLAGDSLLADEVARQAEDFRRYADGPSLVEGACLAVKRVAQGLEGGYPNLAWMLRTPTSADPPLLAVAFTFFFCREVEGEAGLSRGLLLDGLRQLSASQAKAFDELSKALATLGDRDDSILKLLDAHLYALKLSVKEAPLEDESLLDEVFCRTLPLEHTLKVPDPESDLWRSLTADQVRSLLAVWMTDHGTQPQYGEDSVDCAVFAPSQVRRGETVLVQAFAFAEGREAEAAALAGEFDEEAVRRGFATLDMLLRRGQTLRFHLSMGGVALDDPVRELTWLGRTASVQFAVDIPADRLVGGLVGTLLVSTEGVPVGRIGFKLSVVESPPARPAEPVSVGEAASRFRKAFVSYARVDRAEVVRRVQMLHRPLTDIEVFQDILGLEPGDFFESVLFRRIDECDIFMLFWSSNARQSEWVRREIEYARKRQGPNGEPPPTILPVIIEGPPPPPPPPELAYMNFNDYLLYLIG